MSFRKDGKASLPWRRWKTAHEDTLLRCGLPDYIIKTERSWILFLQEAYYPVTGWKPEMLRKDQQLALYDFVRQQYGNTQHPFLLRVLEQSLGVALPISSDSA